MTKISGIVIAKNEEDMIADCLDSLDFCDEVIVVDSGSEDRTIDIAKRLGAKIIKYQTDDFSIMRTVGLKNATNQWVLYVDADERVSKELAEEIKFRVSNNSNERLAGFKLRRKNYYFGHYEWPFIEKLERLFKKNSLKDWYGKLHESPNFEGELEELTGFLLHYTHRDLSSMVEKTMRWSKIEAELRFKMNHPKMTWWRFPRVMFSAFFQSYIIQQGWKVGTVGMIESIYQAFSIFITYAKLWELQNHETFSKTKKA